MNYKRLKIIVELRDKITNDYVKTMELYADKTTIANMQYLQTKYNVNVIDYRWGL